MIVKPTKSSDSVDYACQVILLKDVTLNEVALLKLLGIIISKNLQRSDHVIHLIGKTNKKNKCLMLLW